jgi:hypothetical protein
VALTAGLERSAPTATAMATATSAAPMAGAEAEQDHHGQDVDAAGARRRLRPDRPADGDRGRATLTSDAERRIGNHTRAVVGLILAVAVALSLLLLGAGCAVTPLVVYQRTTFEGFEVISHVPAQPRAMVFLFHGSNGSASFADRVETTDVLNRLIAQGYGFVSTSSTERTGDRRWDAGNPSPTTNPDLARLSRLRAHLVNTTPASVAAQAGEIRNETALQLAVHQFTAEYAPQVLAFFDRYVPRRHAAAGRARPR